MVDDDVLENNWRDYINKGDQYEKKFHEILGTHGKFPHMRYSRMDQNYHCQTPHLTDIIRCTPVISFTKGPGLKARKFRKIELDKVTHENVIELPQSKQELPVHFASKSICFLRPCIYYSKLNVMSVKDSYLILSNMIVSNRQERHT